MKQHLFDILFFCTFKKMYLKKLVELSINTTFDLKFSCSTGDEWNLHDVMTNRWPHQKTSTLDDVIARNGT